MSARCVDCLNEAIERCEVSGVPLCAGCLWYTDDGRRISERVANQLASQGGKVHSPSAYLSQLGSTALLPTLPHPISTVNRARNGNDLIELIAGVTGLFSFATCFGVGMALCAAPLPLLPLILGGVGLYGARNAARPDQARLLSWIGIAGGAGFILLVMVFVLASIVFGTSTLLPWMTLSRTPTFAP
jgi:hypothetical protein